MLNRERSRDYNVVHMVWQVHNACPAEVSPHTARFVAYHFYEVHRSFWQAPLVDGMM